MKKISLLDAYRLLKKYRHVIFDGDTSRMNLNLNEEGLIIKLKNNGTENVMMFPYEFNESVEVNASVITFHDRMKWRHDFEPLMKVELL
jgi:hypothetical protein